ncbi:hypothetical protein BUALT_Bualt02G0004600 [Buddleja alternifolia]|uniref:SWIM-type domain-containing protein n=1 Tax=Buddleja alternifolia TaxID=168488 RepID=A0AAV6XW82_9LAMI|nr:hypothetical protein BUALT_Bualt02G0004600 [Buddleja alternifolia]
MSMNGAGVFGKFYVCFKGLKDGFLAGCRPYIGVDGCHLKGPNGGVLLAAVGIDPNNNSFPICYAVVGRETKELWGWFLTLLKHDLQIERDYEWTFTSDKQKGLIPAFETVFPTADNRYCVRHLHGNMKKILIKHGDMVTDCIPMKSTDQHYEISFNNNSKCKVDLSNHTCSCRKWELSGIPCKHALSAINAQELNPEDLVHKCYTVETYARVYAPCIYPVNGPDIWKKTGQVPPIPPNLGRGVGRPLRARRLEVDELANKQKKVPRGNKHGGRMKRQQTTIKCSYCGEYGHNKKGCQKRKDAEAAESESEEAIYLKPERGHKDDIY